MIEQACPFCGAAELVVSSQYDHHERHIGFAVECIADTCRAHGPIRRTMTEARAAWSTRHILLDANDMQMMREMMGGTDG